MDFKALNLTLSFNISARALVIIFQLINISLYTNNLHAEQLGIYFFLLTVSYSANALLFVPIDYYQQANLSRVISEYGGARSLLNFNGRMVGGYLVFASLLIAICMTVAQYYVIHLLLAAVLSLLLYVVQALRNTLNNLEYRNCVSVSFVQEAVLKVLLFFFLIQYFIADEVFLIIAWIVSLLVSAIYLFFRTLKHRIFLSTTDHVVCSKEVFSFSYPFSIGAVCNWLQLQGYRLILVPLGYAEEVGIFATLASIGSAAIGAASLIYSQQFTPLIYKTGGKYTGTYLKGAAVVTLVVALGSYMVGDYLVAALASAIFEEHWRLLLFGVVTDAGTLFIGALSIHITLTAHTKKIISSSTVGLLSMVVSFVLLYWVNQISLVTIGVPLLVSQWLVVAYMYWCFKKNTQQ